MQIIITAHYHWRYFNCFYVMGNIPLHITLDPRLPIPYSVGIIFPGPATIGVYEAGAGGGGCSPPQNFSNSHFLAKKKNRVIFRQNHLIFAHAMDKIFRQLTSAPLNKTGPVRLCQPLLKKSTRVLNGFPSWRLYNEWQFWACWLGDNSRWLAYPSIMLRNSLLTEGQIQQVSVLWMWGLTKTWTQLLSTTVM